MIARLLLVLLLAADPLSANEIARIVYIGIDGDPFYDPQPTYTGLSLNDRDRPVSGAEAAARESRVLERVLGIEFSLDIVLAEPGGAATTAKDATDAGAVALLLDLPTDEMEMVAPDTIAFNIRHAEDRWRASDCRPGLLHTYPSHSMLADTLAQHLKAKSWNRVLLLYGDTAEDAVESDAVRRAISKFGLKIAADRPFILTNDPRRRDQSNVALLTGDARHDVVWLVDNEGEFGRYVPYATYAARPVVGSEGLSPVAWHWTYERHGAPQLNQRFRRKNDRDMSSLDWAAWVAVRAVVEAVQRVGNVRPEDIRAFITSDDFSLDLYKGAPGSFRMWDGQLRQPVLLATHNAVIERAPLDGFEHQTDTLDTLGVDEPESTCSF